MSRRLHDWQLRLAALMRERQRMPFKWGRHDCALFAADDVLAVTGVDHGAAFRGTYASAAEAARVLRDVGGLVGLAARCLGAEIEPVMAQAGDVGLCAARGEPLLCVWGGACWLAPGEFGLEVATGVTRAWRVC